MKIEILNSCKDFNSYRASRVKSLFNAESGCEFKHTAELPIEEQDWSIGLIVGPSGSGKTSIGSAIFGGGRLHDLYAGWDSDKPIVDCIDPSGDFNVVTGGTVFWLNSGIDRGDIAAQDWCFIDPRLRTMKPSEAASELWYDTLLDMGLTLFDRLLDDIAAGRIVKRPQDNRFSTWEPTIKENEIYRPDALMLTAQI